MNNTKLYNWQKNKEKSSFAISVFSRAELRHLGFKGTPHFIHPLTNLPLKISRKNRTTKGSILILSATMDSIFTLSLSTTTSLKSISKHTNSNRMPLSTHHRTKGFLLLMTNFLWILVVLVIL